MAAGRLEVMQCGRHSGQAGGHAVWQAGRLEAVRGADGRPCRLVAYPEQPQNFTFYISQLWGGVSVTAWTGISRNRAGGRAFGEQGQYHA